MFSFSFRRAIADPARPSSSKRRCTLPLLSSSFSLSLSFFLSLSLSLSLSPSPSSLSPSFPLYSFLHRDPLSRFRRAKRAPAAADRAHPRNPSPLRLFALLAAPLLEQERTVCGSSSATSSCSFSCSGSRSADILEILEGKKKCRQTLKRIFHRDFENNGSSRKRKHKGAGPRTATGRTRRRAAASQSVSSRGQQGGQQDGSRVGAWLSSLQPSAVRNLNTVTAFNLLERRLLLSVVRARSRPTPRSLVRTPTPSGR